MRFEFLCLPVVLLAFPLGVVAQAKNPTNVAPAVPPGLECPARATVTRHSELDPATPAPWRLQPDAPPLAAPLLRTELGAQRYSRPVEVFCYYGKDAIRLQAELPATCKPKLVGVWSGGDSGARAPAPILGGSMCFASLAGGMPKSCRVECESGVAEKK